MHLFDSETPVDTQHAFGIVFSITAFVTYVTAGLGYYLFMVQGQKRKQKTNESRAERAKAVFSRGFLHTRGTPSSPTYEKQIGDYSQPKTTKPDRDKSVPRIVASAASSTSPVFARPRKGKGKQLGASPGSENAVETSEILGLREGLSKLQERGDEMV